MYVPIIDTEETSDKFMVKFYLKFTEHNKWDIALLRNLYCIGQEAALDGTWQNKSSGQ